MRGTSPSQGVVGDARILFHPPSGLDEPVFEGAFTVGHDTHTIQLERNYMVTKHPLDPTPRRSSLSSRDVQSRDDGASLIIHRQSDVMTSQEHAQLLRKRAGGHLSQRQLFEVRDADAGDSCGHDDQEWNSNAAQQLFSSPAHSANGAGPAAFFVRPPAPQRRWYDDLAELGFGRGYLGDDRLSTSDDAQLAGYLEPRQSVGADVLGSNSTENFIEDIGSTRGCPSSQKVVYVGIAADCTYAQHYGSQDAARTQILNNMNSASGLYKSTFNVSLGVVELNVQGLSCPSTAPSDMPWNVGCNNLQMDDRLSVFSQWRGNKGRDGAGIWHLMTNCSTGSEVGVAWLG